MNLTLLPAKADIIYFIDGMKTICQEKAWIENDQVRCEYAGWVLTYPKNEVLRIVKSNTVKQVEPPEKNKLAPQIIPKDGSTQKNGLPDTGKLTFYDPRRPHKYWTSTKFKHKSYKAAIQALAKRYERSPEWIQAHMGDTNDLLQIHQNLANPELNSENGVIQPPFPKSPGIPFYSPRRSFPYWTGTALKHKSYKEAISTLAKKHCRSPQWVRENMGDSNDLDEIHQNLSNAE